MQNYVKELNNFYLKNAAFWEDDFSWEGFSWIANDDCDQSIIAFRRIDNNKKEIIAVCNFVPVERNFYRIGVPFSGVYTRVFSSDDAKYGGSGSGSEKVTSKRIPIHGYENSIEQIKEQLESRELVKIKVLKNCDLSAKDMAQTIAELTNSEVVQVMGEKITLYKFSTKKGVEHVL